MKLPDPTMCFVQNKVRMTHSTLCATKNFFFLISQIEFSGVFLQRSGEEICTTARHAGRANAIEWRRFFSVDFFLPPNRAIDARGQIRAGTGPMRGGDLCRIGMRRACTPGREIRSKYTGAAPIPQGRVRSSVRVDRHRAPVHAAGHAAAVDVRPGARGEWPGHGVPGAAHRAQRASRKSRARVPSPASASSPRRTKTRSASTPPSCTSSFITCSPRV